MSGQEMRFSELQPGGLVGGLLWLERLGRYRREAEAGVALIVNDWNVGDDGRGRGNGSKKDSGEGKWENYWKPLVRIEYLVS